MTAVKSNVHIKQLASQRLPVPSCEVERLVKENERLRAALEPFANLASLFDNLAPGILDESSVTPVLISRILSARAALQEEGE